MKRILVALTALIVWFALVQPSAFAVVGPNIAQGKPVTCTSSAGGPYLPKNLTDGNQATMWQGVQFPATCTVDLQRVYYVVQSLNQLPISPNLDNILLKFKVEYSVDKINWKTWFKGGQPFYNPKWMVVGQTPNNGKFAMRYYRVVFPSDPTDSPPYHVQYIGSQSTIQASPALSEIKLFEY